MCTKILSLAVLTILLAALEMCDSKEAARSNDYEEVADDEVEFDSNLKKSQPITLSDEVAADTEIWDEPDDPSERYKNPETFKDR